MIAGATECSRLLPFEAVSVRGGSLAHGVESSRYRESIVRVVEALTIHHEPAFHEHHML